MSDFLNFLNTADFDTLVKIPGITRPIAGNIVSARPFDSVEDCLQVKGMGKNLLARIQSAFEAGETVSESRAMIQVEEDAPPASIEKSRPAQESAEEKPSFLSRLGRAFMVFLQALARLIATVIVLGGFGAALYYGLPFINDKVIVPIEQNSAEITRLESEVQTLQTELNETNNRIDTLEKSIEAHSASLTKLDEIQAALESEIQQKQDENLLALKHEVMLTRVLDMLGRARLYLAQSNFGLAKEDVQSARDVLAELQTETQDAVFDQVIVRLDMALGNLPAFPVVAAGDVEIAWQLLVTGKAENSATATPSPTQTSAPTATGTEAPSATPTPTEIPSATPTP